MNTAAKPLPSPIRVVLVEDVDAIRDDLALLIDGAPGFRCAGAWGSMEDALAALPARLADVALCDIGLPGMSGIEGIRLLRERYPALVTLVLSVHSDDERVFEALCAGAQGYLLKKTAPDRLLEGITDAMLGGSPISPEIARRVVTMFQRFSPPPASDCGLTPHEHRLLRLIVDGHTYRSAGTALGCSPNTIKFHLGNIYRKLQVHSKTDAVARALRDRLV